MSLRTSQSPRTDLCVTAYGVLKSPPQLMRAAYKANAKAEAKAKAKAKAEAP